MRFLVIIVDLFAKLLSKVNDFVATNIKIGDKKLLMKSYNMTEEDT